MKLTQTAAANHCWFRGIASFGPVNPGTFSRCGEVDAASRMPAALFEPKNAEFLKLYEKLTVAFYKAPFDPELGKLAVGRCKDIGFTECGSAEQGVVWANAALMDPICASKCNCNFDGPGEKSPSTSIFKALPYCKDEPDDPKAAKWCSLCGPKFNAPITITLCNKIAASNLRGNTDAATVAR